MVSALSFHTRRISKPKTTPFGRYWVFATHLSYFPQSHGDEGTGGGVRSGTVGGKGVFVTHSKSTSVQHPDGRKGWIIREGDLVV